MNKTSAIINGLSHLLSEADLTRFAEALQQSPPVSIRLHPGKPIHASSGDPVPWCPNGRYLPERPVFTLDPYFHAGCYYVQEASSMFIYQVLQQLMPEQPARMLDLCAAPGGKTTLMASFLRENDLLVANEMIRTRCSVLRENVLKFGDPRVLVTNNEPQHFSAIDAFFDIVLVDAPCSGEGMIRKDEEALKEWSPENVTMCASRQEQIIQSVWPSLKEGGILIYSTCTYNAKENEEQLAWMERELGAENVAMDIPEAWNILQTSTSGITGYRFLPHRVKGEGFFLSVVRKPGKHHGEKHLRKERTSSTKKASELLPWIKPEWQHYLFMEGQHAFIHRFLRETEFLKKHLRFALDKYPLAEQKGKDWIPAPEFALNIALNPDHFERLDLDREDALRFLKTEETHAKGKPGWNLITYHNVPLGWIKQLPNRSNNYFPKEWKIRMEIR